MQATDASLQNGLAEVVSAAVRRVVPEAAADTDPLVRPSEHADFQSNVVLALAKRYGRKPRDLAADLASAIGEEHGDALAVEVSGPGFLNVSVADRLVWARLGALAADGRLGVPRPLVGDRTVIDYSGPNIAKEMHVGHLRTTIIGDALVRVLDFLGSEVLRQNHLGDWGTQFGMLIQYLDETPSATWRQGEAADEASVISRLDTLYREARKAFDADAGFADRARARVVALQSGDPETVAVWRDLVAESEAAFQAVYDRLGVLLGPEDSAGESTYNDALDAVVREAVDAGVAVESEGALCVFPESGEDVAPMILRKRDGGYGYATTDLATIRHRAVDLKATRVLYVVDARQSQHFAMIFETARRMGWIDSSTEVVHVAFGSVLGPDGRPFKTRSGETVRLMDLLDSAVTRAREEILSRRDDLDDTDLAAMSETAAIGAVKYADLSTSRTKDYVFDPARMVSFNGNTGVYLQYAHARISSILRRLPADEAAATVDPAAGLHPAERALALQLDGFGPAVEAVADRLEPHRLCVYLFALAKAFTEFYENCPVLRADDEITRANRAVLCQVTRRTLERGLGLLGIAAPDRM